MDTKTLIADAKARFSHAASKNQLQDKYTSKLIVADQGGLWKADQPTITFLSVMEDENLVLVDGFNNPVLIDRAKLLAVLTERYRSVTTEWYTEWKTLESNR